MKKLLFGTIAVLLSVTLSAQQPTFTKDNLVGNLTIGFGSVLYSGFGYTSSVPPIALSVEKGIKDGILDKGVISVGGYLGYSAHKWEYSGWGWKYSNIVIGARGTFHYPLVDKLDTYTGLMIGYDIVTAKEFGTSVLGYSYNSSSSGLIWSWYAGGRYYFNDKIAGVAEIGYGIAWFNIGLAYKIK